MQMGSFSRRVIRTQSLCTGILLGLTALLGLYHIGRTVVISEDGVFYIQSAQTLPSGYADLCRKFPPGFPVLLSLTHKILFFPPANSSSTLSWIYSSQLAVLLTQLGSVFLLWKIGCRLFRPVWTFGGLLILLVLPVSKHGCDVLRDWPHLLFLSAAFYALLRNLEKQTLLGWMVSAFLGGVGYLFRPECAQILLYLAAVLALLFWRQKTVPNAGRLLLAGVLAAGAWLLPVLPYWTYADSILPGKLLPMLHSATPDFFWNSDAPSEKGLLPMAAFDLVQDLIENMLYFLFPFWLLGLWHFIKSSIPLKNLYRTMTIIFLIVNMSTLLLLHMGWGYICRRHMLPFIALSCPFIPLGIWHFCSSLPSRLHVLAKLRTRYVYIGLLSIALLTATPKLIRPLHFDKKIYIEAARWIAAHTEPQARIFSEDKRIPFYAERPIAVEEKDADYRILITPKKSTLNSLPADSSLQTWSNEKTVIQFCKTAGSTK